MNLRCILHRYVHLWTDIEGGALVAEDVIDVNDEVVSH